MRLVCISDTHNHHTKLQIPDGDVLIHAGDFTGTGKKNEIESFISWFKKQSHANKILVLGNHERTLDLTHREARADLVQYVMQEQTESFCILNSEKKVVQGITFFGTPVQPEFCGWAFNFSHAWRERFWQNVSHLLTDVQVLLTHCPPYGILDKLERGELVGDPTVKHAIEAHMPALKLHIFGHIHYAFGQQKVNNVHYVNAAQCNERNELVQQPVVIEFN